MDELFTEREVATREMAIRLRAIRLAECSFRGGLTLAESADVFREAARLALLPTEEFAREVKCPR